MKKSLLWEFFGFNKIVRTCSPQWHYELLSVFQPSPTTIIYTQYLQYFQLVGKFHFPLQLYQFSMWPFLWTNPHPPPFIVHVGSHEFAIVDIFLWLCMKLKMADKAMIKNSFSKRQIFSFRKQFWILSN